MDKRIKKHKLATEESLNKKRKVIVNESVLTSDNKIQFNGSHLKKLIKGDHPLGGKALHLIVDNISNKT